MIMSRNDDGTYSQVGFIKDSDGNDTEYIYDKDGTVLFEKGFTREKSASLPLQLDGIGKDLKDYTLYGNTIQNGSPTPDNPVEVQAVGDRTGNLFDGEWEKGIINGTTGANTSHDDYVRGKNFIQVFPLTSYRITTTLETDSTFNFLIYEYKSDGSYNLTTNKLGSVFTTNADTHFIRIRTNKTIEVTGEKPEVMVSLNSGTEPLPYEPYGYKIPVETRGKNLFDEEYEDGYISFTTGELVADSGRYRATNFIPVIPNTTYTFSKSSGTGYFWVIGYKDDFIGIDDGRDAEPARVTSSSNNKTVLTFTTTPTTRYLKWYTTTKSGVPTQLELGSTATEYEPYHEPITTTAYIDKPLYKIGDYADSINYAEQKAERVVKELVLTGEEKFQKNNAITNSRAFALYGFDTPYISKIGLCTHLINTTSSYTTGNSIYFGNKIHLCFDLNSEIATDTALLAWLKEQYANGTPVKIYYVLATPETESVTLPKIQTLDGTTAIDVETEIKPNNMYIKYKSRR